MPPILTRGGEVVRYRQMGQPVSVTQGLGSMRQGMMLGLCNGGTMIRDIPTVLEKLLWMRRKGIWPNGERYLWTDAFGLVLLVSLYNEMGDERILRDAEDLVVNVERVLGRPLGLRIGEAPGRGGQYFHYLAMWAYALGRLGAIRPIYREKAIELVRRVHPRFVRSGEGVYWKMEEDLSGPSPGHGYGTLDPFQGYVVYSLLAPEELAAEIRDMRRLMDFNSRGLHIDQDLGLGLMLWLTHFFPDEPWARFHRERSLAVLDGMWIDPPGYFCRHPGLTTVRFAFTNYGISLGLQAVGQWEERVRRLNEYFRGYRSGDHYDTDPITHVMECVSHFPGEFLRIQNS